MGKNGDEELKIKKLKTEIDWNVSLWYKFYRIERLEKREYLAGHLCFSVWNLNISLRPWKKIGFLHLKCSLWFEFFRENSLGKSRTWQRRLNENNLFDTTSTEERGSKKRECLKCACFYHIGALVPLGIKSQKFSSSLKNILSALTDPSSLEKIGSKKRECLDGD